MQRLEMPIDSARHVSAAMLRWHHVTASQRDDLGKRDASVIYVVPMRNMPTAEIDDWATFVKHYRAMAGMTQQLLADRVNVARETIWRWETGRQVPQEIETVLAVADALRVEGDLRQFALVAAKMHPGQPGEPPSDARLKGLDPHDRIVQRILNGPWDDEMKGMMLDELRARRAQEREIQRAREMAEVERAEQMWRRTQGAA